MLFDIHLTQFRQNMLSKRSKGGVFTKTIYVRNNTIWKLTRSKTKPNDTNTTDLFKTYFKRIEVLYYICVLTEIVNTWTTSMMF